MRALRRYAGPLFAAGIVLACVAVVWLIIISTPSS